MSEEPNDSIANLIRLAGPRVRASDDRAARVREAVRDEWLHATKRRGRMRVFAIAAAITIAIIGATLMRRTTRVPPTAIPYVERVVKTETQFASLDWRGVTLRLDKATTIRFVSDDAIALDRGAIYFDGHGSQREVRTTLGTIRDVGTQFDVRIDADALRIRVREGRVDFRGNRIDAGNELVAHDDRIDRHAIARSGEAWAWVEQAAPPIRLEGMTLRHALARIAREKGLALGNVPNGDVTLHGNVPLSPAEALDAATAAAGVTYRIRNETLILSRR